MVEYQKDTAINHQGRKSMKIYSLALHFFLFLTSLLTFIQAEPMVKAPLCKTAQECADLTNSCNCYCSRKCGPRAKQADDKPVFVANDPYGNYCYCKQWDLDNVNRCIADPVMPGILQNEN